MGETIILRAADGFGTTAYVARPKGRPKGALVVIQEIFGVNHHIKNVADGFAKHGYVAVAPAMFDRVERGLEIGYTPPDIERGRGLMQKMKLEDESHVSIPEFMNFLRIHLCNVAAVNQNFALRRKVEGADQVEKGAFSAAAGAAEHTELFARNFEADVLQIVLPCSDNPNGATGSERVFAGFVWGSCLAAFAATESWQHVAEGCSCV